MKNGNNNYGSTRETRKYKSVAIVCFYICCIQLCFPISALNQPTLHYIEKITTSQGLSSNRVSDVVQDKDGFLWIGTSHGLNRYDGTGMVHYFANASNNALSDNNIYRLVTLDDSTRIAIATHHGLSILDTRTESFHNIYFPSDSVWEAYDNTIILLEKDMHGNLWAGTPTRIYRLDPKLHISKIFRGNYKPTDIRNKRLRYVQKIIPLVTGDVLIWLNSGLKVWHPPGLRKAGEGDNLVGIHQWQSPKLLKVLPPDATDYTDTRIKKGHNYFYWIAIVNKKGKEGKIKEPVGIKTLK